MGGPSRRSASPAAAAGDALRVSAATMRPHVAVVCGSDRRPCRRPLRPGTGLWL